MLPCASSVEKEGSITNSGRLMQWRYRAVQPVGIAKPDGDIIAELYFKVKALYEKEGGPNRQAITKLTWNYGKFTPEGHYHLDVHAIAKEINGYFFADKLLDDPATKQKKLFKKGQLVPTFALLQDDGSTSSGDWVYCGSYTDAGNMAARRGKADPTGLGLYPQWAWSWPVNRRIIYNGASVNPQTGKPWNPARAIIKWDGTKWTGDVPDGVGDPGSGRGPFIMKPDGVASLYGPGLTDGPFPEHYEPLECPIEKNLLSAQYNNPTVKRWEKEGVGTEHDTIATCDPRFPFICSTYRVTEHWQTGVQTRWVPWLAEMQPGMFVEIGEELAKERGFKNGETVIVKSSRGEVEAVAIVTPRFKPFDIDGNIIHQVGIPWHYGWATTAERKYNANDKKPEIFTFGDSANLLTPYAGDPNTMIPESKAFMVNVVRKGVK